MDNDEVNEKKNHRNKCNIHSSKRSSQGSNSKLSDLFGVGREPTGQKMVERSLIMHATINLMTMFGRNRNNRR